jgi:hypothetical protein
MALIWFLFLLQPSAFDLQDGPAADLIADARLLAFELIPLCVNNKNSPEWPLGPFRTDPFTFMDSLAPARPALAGLHITAFATDRIV